MGVEHTHQLESLHHLGALPAERRERLAAHCREVVLKRGETLFLAGEEARWFFLVLEGAVRLYRTREDGHVQVVHVMSAGMSFAEAAALCFGQYPVHCDAIQASTRLLRIPSREVLEALEEEPALGARMIGAMSQRMLRLLERIEELTLIGAEARLAHHLLRQPSRSIGGDGVAVRIELGMPKSALAASLAITPETLSRVLRGWRDSGIARSEGNAVDVLNSGALERISHERGPA